MTGIRRVSQLGTTGESTYVDGSIQAVDIADGAVGTAKIDANAITQAKLSTDIPLSGFRNVLINGDMRINQRGSSYTSVGYTLDRWNMTVTGAYTVSQSTSTPPTGFQNFMRVQRTSGSTNTGLPQFFQSLETSASIPLQGKQVTVSFYARAGANYSATSNAFNWRIYAGTGTDQAINAYTGQTILFDQSVTLTTSWQRFTYTTTALTSYNEYGLFFFTVPTGTAGAADYVDITGVQLEVGSQATPFEQRPIGVELALCQRYYFRKTATATAPYAVFGTGQFGGGTTTARAFIPLPVPLRTLPNAIDTGGALNMNHHYVTNYAATSIISNPNSGTSTTQAEIGMTIPSAGPAAGTMGAFGAGNGANAYLGFSAEL